MLWNRAALFFSFSRRAARPELWAGRLEEDAEPGRQRGKRGNLLERLELYINR